MLAAIAFHVTAGRLEAINWDEFALYRRVQDAVTTGVFSGGGRPGLAILMLIPFVSDCSDALTTSNAARLVWHVFGVGYPVGLYFVLRDFFRVRARNRDDTAGSLDALLGVGLLVLVPLWLRWSLHVRTDQPALFFVLWAVLAMFRSERRAAWAVVAGGLAASGYLSSQKAVYIGEIAIVLVVVRTWMGSGFSVRRDLIRVAGFLVGAGVCYAVFRVSVGHFFTAPPVRGGGGGAMDSWTHYRDMLNYRLYPYLLPLLIPHAVLLLALVVATVSAIRGRLESYRELIASWLCLLLGALTAAFHTSGFAYFWMTIGVFPAVALAIALGPIRELLARLAWRERWLAALHGGAWLILLAQCQPTAVEGLQDTQFTQRNAFEFIEKNFDSDEIGFQVEGALFCRQPKAEFRAYFTIQITKLFQGEKNVARARAFAQQFRDKPVAFVIRSARLLQFPPLVHEFWNEHYVRASWLVMVPGFQSPGDNTSRSVDVIIAGRYHWRGDSEGSAVWVDDKPLLSGEIVELDSGQHRLKSSAPGALIRMLRDDHGYRGGLFYSSGSWRELIPRPFGKVRRR